MKSQNNKKIFAVIMLLSVLSLSITSCKKLLDKTPETYLTANNMYRDVYDADAAVIGVYGKLMNLSKQYIVLNELRADLLQVTDNADANLRELNTHSVSAGNPYADPTPFYSVINACNDVLKNLKIMIAANKLKQSEFDQRYSDIGALRSWLYLQLGIHWGDQVKYVTNPLETITAVKDLNNYPTLAFNTLLDSLISFTNTLPYQQPYPFGTSINTGLITNFDGSNTRRFFIDKFALLGDLNLWKGNYTQAASFYRKLMEPNLNGYDADISGLFNGGDQFYQEFKQPYADVAKNNDLCVGYIRYKESDLGSLIDNNAQGWRSIFARSQDLLWYQQMVWVLPFNSNFAPTNPFVDLFSNQGGSYLVKPSTVAMNNWNSQMQSSHGGTDYYDTLPGFPFDARGNFTWRTISGQPVIVKYLYNYLDATSFVPTNILTKNGQWFLNRAANIHLHFAEAANRDGRKKLAYAFVNKGISSTFDPNPGVSGRDVTGIMNTLYDNYPYNFDARNGETPRYRGDWYRNAGIRGCAGLKKVTISGDSTLAIENSILNESALELAYEGHRWPDLVRIALRRNDPSVVANAVYQKLLKDGNPQAAAVQTKLMDKKNWYLPFK
jgi:hypothetical protein